MTKPKDNPVIDPKLIDQIIKNCSDPMDIFKENGLMMQLKKAIVERMLEGELTTTLGYEKHDPTGHNSGNSRNGHTEKILKCKDDQVVIKVPRDRNGDF
jgi:putative transposase